MVGRISSCDTFARGGSDATNRIAAATSSGFMEPSFETCSFMNFLYFGSATPAETSVVVAPGSMMHTNEGKRPVPGEALGGCHNVAPGAAHG